MLLPLFGHSRRQPNWLSWVDSRPSPTPGPAAGSHRSCHSLNHDRIAKLEPHASFEAAPPDGRDGRNQPLASISPLHGNRRFSHGIEQRQSANAVFGICLSCRMGLELPLSLTVEAVACRGDGTAGGRPWILAACRNEGNMSCRTHTPWRNA